jgi:hypothetical protein
VGSSRSEFNEDTNRVVRFPLRTAEKFRKIRDKASLGRLRRDYSPVPDLTKYQLPESDDEYRHRMTVNAVAFVFTSLLVLAGVWVAITIVHSSN